MLIESQCLAVMGRAELSGKSRPTVWERGSARSWHLGSEGSDIVRGGNRWSDRGLVLALALWLSMGAILAAPQHAHAEEPDRGVSHFEVGWCDQLVVGRWCPLRVTWYGKRPGKADLLITAPDAEGHLATFVNPIQWPEGGGSQATDDVSLTGLFQIGRLEGTIEVAIRTEEGPQSVEEAIHARQAPPVRIRVGVGGSARETRVLPLSTQLVIVPGGGAGWSHLSGASINANKVSVDTTSASGGSDGSGNRRTAPFLTTEEVFAEYGLNAAELSQLPLNKSAVKTDANSANKLTDIYAREELDRLVAERKVRRYHADYVPVTQASKNASNAVYQVVTPALGDHALPARPADYDAAFAVVLRPQALAVTEAQSAALAEWVRSGGQLIVSLAQPAAFQQSPLSKWLRIKVGEQPATIRDLAALESYVGRAKKLTIAQRLPITKMLYEQGELLAGTKSEPLMIRQPEGLGSVTFFALDWNAAPLRDWESLPDLLRKLTSDRAVAATLLSGANPKEASTQLSSSGITDLATQFYAGQDHFPQVQRISPWSCMGLMVLYLLLIGPADYLLVHRVLKRPQGTWFTFPLLILASGGLAVATAAQWNGTETVLHQWDLVDHDQSTGQVHGRSWAHLHAGATQRCSLSVVPTLSPPKATHPVRLSWVGTPDTSFSGLYREQSTEIGQSRYEVQVHEGSIRDLPLTQWGTFPLCAEWDAPQTNNFIESQLTANQVGRLSGTIKLKLDDTLDDWFIAYANRVYRFQPKGLDGPIEPLPAGQVFRIDQPSVTQRELQGFLTRATAGAAQRQERYDPLDLDPGSILRMLSFHEEAGGTGYTQLTNQAFEGLDCSRQLRLGRAVLFGRLKTAAAAWQLGDAPVKVANRVTYVRMILPVERTGEVLRSIPKLYE